MSEDNYRLVSESLRDGDTSLSSEHVPIHRPQSSLDGTSPARTSVADDNGQTQKQHFCTASTLSVHKSLESSEYVLNPAAAPGRHWRTGYMRNVPWVGLGSLMLALCSTLASAIVLATSNGAAVSTWRVSPSVVLAVLSAIIIICLRVALMRGLTISWWRHMLNGASLADAHRYWDYGNGVWPAITAGRHFNILSAATILVTIAVIEGPLIQKSSTIASRSVSTIIKVQAAVAPTLPSGYTADVTGEFRKPTTPTLDFSEVFSSYTNHEAITSGIDGCPGVCESNNVPGVGFKVSCAPDVNSTWSMKNYGNAGQAQFMASTDWQVGDLSGFGIMQQNGSNEYLSVHAGWSTNSGDDPFTFTQRSCNLTLAMVSYPLKMVNNTITLDLPLGTNPDVMFDLPVAQTPAGHSTGTGPTTLGGFYLLGNDLFYANVTMIPNGALGIFTLEGLNSFAWSHTINPDWNVMQFQGYVWRDPINDTLAAYHELMFRLALRAGGNATIAPSVIIDGGNYTSVRNISMVYTYDENYFVSRFDFWGSALALIMLAVLTVSPTYRGWWKIGRPTTLSPLETAKAFGAPLLADCNSNDTVEDLVNDVRSRRVKYGVLYVGDEGNVSTLQVAEDGDVYPPGGWTIFQR